MFKDQLIKALNTHNLSEHIPVFLNLIDNEEFSLSDLQELSLEELKEFGIAKITQRKTILKLIKNLSQANLPADIEAFQPARIQQLALNPLLHSSVEEYFAEPTPKGKLLDMTHAIEAVFKLLALYGISVLAEEKKIDNELKKSLANKIKAPTLRGWIEINELIFSDYLTKRAFKRLQDFVLQTLKDFVTHDQNGDLLDPKNSFITLRNSIAHAGISAVRAQELLEIWHPRFEKLMFTKSVLAELKLAVIHQKKQTVLTQKNVEEVVNQFASLKRKPNLFMVFGRQKTPLKPLILFDRMVGDQDDIFDDIKIYNRTFNRSIGFTSTLNSLYQADNRKETMLALKALFEYVKPIEATFQFPDQAEELVTQAKGIWGRDDETKAVVDHVLDFKHEISLVTGVAGSGKSAVFLKVFDELHSKSMVTPHVLVLPYKLSSVDVKRNQHRDFIKYCNERIRKHFNFSKEIDKEMQAIAREHFPGEKNTNVLTFLASCKYLEEQEIGKVLIVIDGLDEIIKPDPGFIEETVLQRQQHSVTLGSLHWLIFSRNNDVISKALSSVKPARVFKSLPKMSSEDMRQFIFNEINIPPIQKKLVAKDEPDKKGDNIRNQFIEKVLENADGYPLYVKYLINDLRSNKFPDLDFERLPNSLDAYHHKILTELSIGDIGSRRTPILGILALALEPLSFDEIYQILIKAHPLYDNQEVFKQALESLASLLIVESDPEGEEGYKLFHESFKEYLLSDRQMNDTLKGLKAVYCNFSVNPSIVPQLSNYFYRCGYRHLADNQAFTDLKGIFLDFKYIVGMANAFDQTLNSFTTQNPLQSWLLGNELGRGSVGGLDYFLLTPGRSAERFGTELMAIIYDTWQKSLAKSSISIANLFKKILLPAWLQPLGDQKQYEILIDLIRREYPHPKTKELLASNIFVTISKILNAKKHDLKLLMLLQANFWRAEGEYAKFILYYNKANQAQSLDITSPRNLAFIKNQLTPHLNRLETLVSKKDKEDGMKPMSIMNYESKYFSSKYNIEDKRYSRQINTYELALEYCYSLRMLQKETASKKYLTKILTTYSRILQDVNLKKLDVFEIAWMGEMYLEPISFAAKWLPAKDRRSNALILRSLKSVEAYYQIFYKKFHIFYAWKGKDEIHYPWNASETNEFLIEIFSKATRHYQKDLACYLYSSILKMFNQKILPPWHREEFKDLEIRYYALWMQDEFGSYCSQDSHWKSIDVNQYKPLSYELALKEGEVIYDAHLPHRYVGPGPVTLISFERLSTTLKIIRILECKLYLANAIDTKFKKDFKEIVKMLKNLMQFNEEIKNIPEGEPWTYEADEAFIIQTIRLLFAHADRVGSEDLKKISANQFKKIVAVAFKNKTNPVYFEEVLKYAD